MDVESPSKASGYAVHCEICGKGLSRKGDLKRHLKLHDPNKDDLKFRCSFPGCTYRNLQQSNVRSHENIHLGVKPYTCGERACGFSTADPGSLTRHRRRTHGVDLQSSSSAASTTSSALSSPAHLSAPVHPSARPPSGYEYHSHPSSSGSGAMSSRMSSPIIQRGPSGGSSAAQSLSPFSWQPPPVAPPHEQFYRERERERALERERDRAKDSRTRDWSVAQSLLTLGSDRERERDRGLDTGYGYVQDRAYGVVERRGSGYSRYSEYDDEDEEDERGGRYEVTKRERARSPPITLPPLRGIVSAGLAAGLRPVSPGSWRA